MEIRPNYLSLDYDTIKQEIIDTLQQTETFKDYNFEGSNIAVLIELIAYLGDLNTYYLNKIIKNMSVDTTEIYENAHVLSQLIGYSPLGYNSSSTELSVKLSQDVSGTYFSYGDILYLPKHKNFGSEFEGNNIPFVSVEDVYSDVGLSFTENGDSNELYEYQFTAPIRQGKVITYTYYGSDIFNNKILLPFLKFDHSRKNIKEQSVWLTINDINWTRVNNFYEDLSGLDNLNRVFKLTYDKYERYLLEFSPNLNVPEDTDEIKVNLIQTLGEDGNVGANTVISIEDDELVYNVTKDTWIPNDKIRITNPRATRGGTDPENVDQLKEKSRGYFNAQLNCVTPNDYKAFMENYDGILKGVAWGQNELRYNSDTRDYNKVYLSMIPQSWGLSYISVRDDVWVLDNGKQADIIEPDKYLDSFKSDFERYLEPYKATNIYHVYRLPNLVYFTFDISLSVRNNYNYVTVLNDVKDKLSYYYRLDNCNFGQKIDYKDVEDMLIDKSFVSPDRKFTNIEGIKSVRVRDIHTNTTINEPNKQQNYPQYLTDNFNEWIENKLRDIQLGPWQFPVFKSSVMTFLEG